MYFVCLFQPCAVWKRSKQPIKMLCVVCPFSEIVCVHFIASYFDVFDDTQQRCVFVAQNVKRCFQIVIFLPQIEECQHDAKCPSDTGEHFRFRQPAKTFPGFCLRKTFFIACEREIIFLFAVVANQLVSVSDQRDSRIIKLSVKILKILI